MTTQLLERLPPSDAPPLPDVSEGADKAKTESKAAQPSLSPSSSGPMQVVVVRRLSDLEPYRMAWEDLGAAACEPNIFYEPWMLIPGIQAFAGGRAMEFHLVFAPGHGPDAATPILNGFFPFERRRRVKGVPVRSLVLWKHLYSMLCTPLVRKGQELETLNALLDHAEKTPSAPEVMEWNSVPADRAFGQTLVEVFRARRTLTFVDECWNRSLIRPNSQGDGDLYLKTALSGKRRKELKRQENRLMESGRAHYNHLDPETNSLQDYEGANLQTWIEHFLELESRGWKGEEGSAFACDPVHREFFRAIVTEAHSRRRLMLMSLTVNDRPIAMKCDFLAGNGAFAFKIAYDEEQSRFSPGVQLEIEGIQRLHRSARLRWMDSGAVPNHFMINRLWTERRTLQNFVLATGRGRGELVVSLLPLLRYGRRVATWAQKRFRK